MAKLTDTQLILLSKAALREDGAASVPERLNRTAAAKVGASLIARKLMREMRTKPGMPVWRTDDEGRRTSLIITRAGRDAIGATEEAPEAQQPIEATTARPRSVAATTGAAAAAAAPRVGTKQALVVAMLAKDKGATLDALVEATGWLPHTTRAAITGLRKRGFTVERTPNERFGSLYRIIGTPTNAVRA